MHHTKEMMEDRPALRRQAVVSLNQADFDAACAELLHRATLPDVLIGIPTGGLWVAEAMARAVPVPGTNGGASRSGDRGSYVPIRTRLPSPWSGKAGPSANSPKPAMSTRQLSIAT